MGLLARIAAVFGRGDEDGLSVPPMDGVLKPNNRLDTADHMLKLPEIDNLAVVSGVLHCSSGRNLFRVDLPQKKVERVRTFDGPITSLAASPLGAIVVAVEGHGVEYRDRGSNWRRLSLDSAHHACVSACAFLNEDEVALAIGSLEHPMSGWKRDLMSHGHSGRVVIHRIATGETEIVSQGLAFPYGIAASPDGSLLVSESWRHRVVSLDRAGTATPIALLSDLPAYPARLIPLSDGGFSLSLFAPRRQLTELVLREDDYRREMMATIPEDVWIGPAFSDGGEAEPLQAGSVRQMGVMKPWAPSRSYGLVVRLGRDLVPTASYHSRADGSMHGIASTAELDGFLYAASRGSGTLLRIPVAAETAA